MQCKKCLNTCCGDDECDYCDEIICTGLCPSCHIQEKCTRCNAELDLQTNNFIRTVGYSYFCNKNCYDEWKL